MIEPNGYRPTGKRQRSRLKEVLYQQGLSVKAISEISGVEKAVVQEALHDLKNISIRDLLKLCATLRIMPSYVLDRM